jgi:flagellar hook-length control protein FliK
LQNLAAAVNAGVTATTDKTGNAFQNTVNTVANSNPNGSVDSSQILNQITQQVASQTADAKMVNRLSFQLVPESLGRVTVQVALVDQAISARIMVSNPDVREVLQQHMVDLKAALSQAGLQIDQMQVQVQGGGANLLNQYFQYQQEGNSYRESAWTPSNTPEIVQNSDNSSLLVTAGSSSLNFLV